MRGISDDINDSSKHPQPFLPRHIPFALFHEPVQVFLRSDIGSDGDLAVGVGAGQFDVDGHTSGLGVEEVLGIRFLFGFVQGAIEDVLVGDGWHG
jgi:hypothetical protein